MEIKIISNKKELIFYQNKISLEISEEQGTEGAITKAELVMTLPKFITDISSLECSLGVFNAITLEAIGIGSVDTEVIYKFKTYDFILNELGINHLLEENQRMQTLEISGVDKVERGITTSDY